MILQQRLRCRSGKRSSPQIALNIITIKLPKELQLRFLFDTLRRDREAQPMRELNDALDHLGIPVLRVVIQQSLIELHLRKGQIAQIADC